MNTTLPSDDRFTLEEYEALSEDDTFLTELVRGRLVREPRPGVKHGRIQVSLAATLLRHIEDHGLGGWVLTESGFLLSRQPPTVRGPDIAYIGEARLAAGEPTVWADYAPDLAVEILSPRDSASAMTEKVIEYLEAGARLLWVVNPEGRRVTVYQSRSNVHVVAEPDFLTGEDVLPDLRIDLSVLFGD